MIKSKIKSVPNKLHVKTGDTVVVISGRSNKELRSEKSGQMGDKGKVGKVLKVFPKTGKIIVEGDNIKKKHIKPNQQNAQVNFHNGQFFSDIIIIFPLNF